MIGMEVKTQNQRKKFKNRDWSSELPSEILEIFCKHLTLTDQLRFGSACKSWYSSASKRTHPAAPQPPWLITNNYDFTSDKYEIFSILENKSYKIEKPIKNNKTYIAASSMGWLVIQADNSDGMDDELYLQNLFSKLQIDLPSRHTMPDYIRDKGDNSYGMDVPLNFAISICTKKNPIIIALVTYGGDLALCKVGDKAWKGHQGNIAYANLTFHNDKLYVIENSGKIDIYRVDDALQLLLMSSIDSPSALPIPITAMRQYQAYLVESQGNLLVVKKSWDDSLKFPDKNFEFEILKLADDCDPPRLAMVDSLNDQVLFLGKASESLPAKDCAGAGIRGNHIYFTGVLGHGSSDFGVGVYSVEDRVQLRGVHLLPQEYQSKSLLWVSPTFAFQCNCKCNCAMRMTHVV